MLVYQINPTYSVGEKLQRHLPLRLVYLKINENKNNKNVVFAQLLICSPAFVRIPKSNYLIEFFNQILIFLSLIQVSFKFLRKLRYI